jgi:hypothetical protein
MTKVHTLPYFKARSGVLRICLDLESAVSDRQPNITWTASVEAFLNVTLLSSFSSTTQSIDIEHCIGCVQN